MRLLTCTLFAILAGGALAACSSSSSGDDPNAPDDDRSADDDIVEKVGNTSSFLGRFSSPTIVRVGDTVHAYFAKQSVDMGKRTETFHVPHATFKNGQWSDPQEVLPKLGTGAKANGPVWAPSVVKVDATRWMLYYTAEVDSPASSQKKCIWRAHATDAAGPFVDDYAGPLWCQDNSLWAIDPYAVHDAHGRLHLAARLDLGNAINSIQIRRLDDNGAHFEAGSQWFLLAKNEQNSWDQHVMENAGLVRLAPPNGNKPPHWFVFYSARHWEDNSYAIGYADCGENINGLPDGCTKVTKTKAWLASDSSSKLYGPGTPTFYTNPAGRQLMSIQAWKFPGGVTGANAAKNSAQGQIMHTYQLTIDNHYLPSVVLERTDE